MLSSADRVGRWVVDSPLELAGLGAAFSAHNSELPAQRCTLLAIEPDDLELTVRQIEQQIRQLGQPAGDLIIPIIDWGTRPEQRMAWLALPPLEGILLREWLVQDRKEPTSVRRMLDDVSAAIGALADRQIKLGWLSPSQIMHDERGVFRLIPLPSPFLTTTAGTAHLQNLRYLAPEYFDQDATPSDTEGGDIYSLAIFAFEALVGRPAFQVPSSQPDTFGTLKRMKAMDGGLDAGNDLPLDIRRALWQSTHGNAGKRPPSISLLADALGPPKPMAVPVVETEKPPPSTSITSDFEPEAVQEAELTQELGLGSDLPPVPPNEPPAGDAWDWNLSDDAVPVEVDDDVELESYRSIGDSIWFRLLLIAALLGVIFAIWFFWIRPPEATDAAPSSTTQTQADRDRDRTTAHLSSQPGARSDAYVFPESWRERTSVTTWTQANFPEAWLEAIAPESWKERALTPDDRDTPAIDTRQPPTPPPGFEERTLMLGQGLRHEGAVELEGIWAESTVEFGIPETWEVWGDPVLSLDVEHSDRLIPEVSTLGVWADGQPTGSFFLSEALASGDSYTTPVQLRDEDGYHSIQFSGYHRSQLPCEGDIGEELWTRITEQSFLRLHYKEFAPERNLARWPYPFVDHRNPDPFGVTLVLPESPDVAALHAAGLIAAAVENAAGWHPISVRTHQGSIDTAPPGNLISIADRTSVLAEEMLHRMRAAADDEVSTAADKLSSDSVLAGISALALLPRSADSNDVILMVVGADAAGLESAALLLASERASVILQGTAEVLNRYTPREKMQSRDWLHSIPKAMSFTLQDMGLTDQMATGFRGGNVTLPVHHVPDEKFSPGRGRLSLVYSYSAQVDPGASKLWIYLDNEPLASVDLADLDGRHYQNIQVDIPVQRVGPDSVINIMFDLRGYEDHTCLGAAHSFLWGTVHSDTRISLPRRTWSRINDLGLLRFGAYPFGIRADLSETTFVLPEAPTAPVVDTYIRLVGEFGRLSQGDRFSFRTQLGSDDEATKSYQDVVIIDEGPDVPLLDSLNLAEVTVDEQSVGSAIPVAHAQDGFSAQGANDGGITFEIRAAPWDRSRSVLIARLDGEQPGAVFECGAALGPAGYLHGRTARLSSCSQTEVLSGRRDAYSGTLPIKAGIHRLIRRYYWSLVATALLLVLIMLLLRYRRRAKEMERDAIDGDNNEHFYHPEGE